MDRITIRNLEVYARHGVYEAEHKLGQMFVISADLFLDTYRAGSSDALEYSVDYGGVCQMLSDLMTKRTFRMIEAAAEYLAKEILRSFPVVDKIRLRLEKPWAPVGLHLDAAGVEIVRGRHIAYISMGSNMGDKEETLARALAELENTDDITVTACSQFVTTKPYGVEDQPDFSNGCVEIETFMEPGELLDTLNQIEATFGRERHERWGPRTLDLDIIFYDDCIINTKQLTIPHPDMQNRRFVLEPLAEIASWYLHPYLHRTVRQLLDDLTLREKTETK